MPQEGRDRTLQQPAAGLCDRCRYAKVVTSDRGATFLLCRRSATDPTFPKYPRLPVLACAGFAAEPTPQDES